VQNPGPTTDESDDHNDGPSGPVAPETSGPVPPPIRYPEPLSNGRVTGPSDFNGWKDAVRDALEQFPRLSYARALSAAGLLIHPPKLGGGKEVHPLQDVDGGSVVFDADTAEATLYINNIPTDIQLVPEYGEDGIESWRPATDADSTELELQTGLVVVSNESVQEALETSMSELAERYGVDIEKVRELAFDPAQGRISTNTVIEAEAALRAAADPAFTEFEGEPARSTLEKSDFVDESGQEWDVKSYRSERNFDAGEAMDKLLDRELGPDAHLNENVLIDTTRMTPEDVEAMRIEVEAEPAAEGRVFFHP